MQLPSHQPCIPVLWCMLDSRQGTHQLGLHFQLPLAQQLRLLKKALLQEGRALAASAGTPSKLCHGLPQGGQDTQGLTAATCIDT